MSDIRTGQLWAYHRYLVMPLKHVRGRAWECWWYDVDGASGNGMSGNGVWLIDSRVTGDTGWELLVDA